MGKKFGISFSWNRMLGISGMKNRISRQIGIPLTKSGRDQKFGRYFSSLFLVPICTKNTLLTDKQSKQVFLLNINHRMQKALLFYLINRGIYITSLNDFKKIKLDSLNGYIENDIEEALLKYKENIRLINDGGNLTSKRKDIFLNTIYLIEDKNNNISKNLVLVSNYVELKKDSIAYGCLICITLICFFTIFLITNKLELSCCICFALILAILFFSINKKRKKINILLKDIQKDFKLFCSNPKNIPDVFMIKQLGNTKKFNLSLNLLTIFVMIFFIIFSGSGRNKTEVKITQDRIYEQQNDKKN